MRTIADLELADAERAAEAAAAEARERGISITVCVTDRGGIPITVRRMDGAKPSGVELAGAKAFTAAIHHRPTSAIAHVAGPGQPGFGVFAQFGGRFSVLPGGVPVEVDGVVVGAVGVSGADDVGDIACAEAAVTALVAA
ncbi:heme-binding protein [Phytoactinopolyspora alkaliphila]|uniref:Heme-binding protein n=1 Tax=Phytoactinopolyspora alkaliphila TaxID=1783498 RepID=A0A6N9YKA0_9ACTN|nr:heme-binding protein [Phytoactinopolyspora alkaliphila]NED95365.1 heme-binding protein [Phytoactinopolyspora alkaliphila]